MQINISFKDPFITGRSINKFRVVTPEKVVALILVSVSDEILNTIYWIYFHMGRGKMI